MPMYTFRYLRLGVILFLLALLATVAIQWWTVDDGSCLLGSISAYYYTPARTIFVGCLFALGTLFIIYVPNNQVEGVLFDFAGFMAFVVAMVPTAPDNSCGPPTILSGQEIVLGVRNNIGVLLFVSAMVLALRWVTTHRATGRHNLGLAPPARKVAFLCGLILAVELTLFLVWFDTFVALSHGIAAVTMVAGVVAVIVESALRAYGPFRRAYGGLALSLMGTLAATLILVFTWTGFAHLILLVEVLVIGHLVGLVAIQTLELWNLPREPLSVGSGSGSGSSG